MCKSTYIQLKWSYKGIEAIIHKSHQTSTCSKLTIKTVEQGVKYVQS